MNKTFTSDLEFPAKTTEKDQDIPSFPFAEPSSLVIQNILNFSLNFETKQSKLVKDVEFLKS